MGRLLGVVLLLGVAAWLLVDKIGIGPGAGVQSEGREVVVDSGGFEYRYSRIGSHDETYVIFGGNATQDGPIHASLGGLPLASARAIAARHPDFYMCRSGGAAEAKRLTQSLSFVAADGRARARLKEANDLFQERLRAGGERTCIRVEGANLLFDSAKAKQSGDDLTSKVKPLLNRTNLVLAERVEVQDCRSLFR